MEPFNSHQFAASQFAFDTPTKQLPANNAINNQFIQKVQSNVRDQLLHVGSTFFLAGSNLVPSGLWCSTLNLQLDAHCSLMISNRSVDHSMKVRHFGPHLLFDCQKSIMEYNFETLTTTKADPNPKHKNSAVVI